MKKRQTIVLTEWESEDGTRWWESNVEYKGQESGGATANSYAQIVDITEEISLNAENPERIW